MNFDDPKHVFVIAEAGSNWKCGSYEEDLNQAKKLIKCAVKAGADAVKFQTYRKLLKHAFFGGFSDNGRSGRILREKNPRRSTIQPSTSLGLRWKRKVRFFVEKSSVFEPRDGHA